MDKIEQTTGDLYLNCQPMLCIVQVSYSFHLAPHAGTSAITLDRSYVEEYLFFLRKNLPLLENTERCVT